MGVRNSLPFHCWINPNTSSMSEFLFDEVKKLGFKETVLVDVIGSCKVSRYKSHLGQGPSNAIRKKARDTRLGVLWDLDCASRSSVTHSYPHWYSFLAKLTIIWRNCTNESVKLVGSSPWVSCSFLESMFFDKIVVLHPLRIVEAPFPDQLVLH